MNGYTTFNVILIVLQRLKKIEGTIKIVNHAISSWKLFSVSLRRQYAEKKLTSKKVLKNPILDQNIDS